MLVVMKASADSDQIEAVCQRIRDMGFTPHPMPGAKRTAIGITGNQGPIEPETFMIMDGVSKAIPVTKPYKLVSREIVERATEVKVSSRGGTDTIFGGQSMQMIAGPCAVENEKMIIETAIAVKNAGVHMLRGGAFKPRSSPYSFQGLEEEGLKYLARAGEETGLPVVTEAVDIAGVDLLEQYVDMIQIGARNMQNFSLLKRAGKSRLPVLLKRGMSATLNELLQAAEYILAGGNYNVVLCERGVRTFADHTRNTLDLSAVPVLKRMTHLPVVVDPSHATGNRLDVLPMSCAAVAAGADGLMIEVHPNPAVALSDGPQSLTPEDFRKLLETLVPVSEAMGRNLDI